MNMKREFRYASTGELSLIDRLLRAEFEGNDALLIQMSKLSVSSLDENGSLELHPIRGVPANVSRRIPVEGVLADTDGVPIHILLHVLEGYLAELEVFREDSQPIVVDVRAHDVDVIVW